jgi:hypothetical protein
MYSDHLEWRTQREPLDERMVRQRFCFCGKGHDVDGNAIVIYYGDRHDHGYDNAKVVDVIINAMRQAIDRSKHAERKVTLLAFTVSGTPKDRGTWRAITQALSHNLPETLAHVFVFPTDMFSRVLWRVISCFLDRVTVGKVKLLSGGRHPDKLPSWVPIDSIPHEFGGVDRTNYDAVL